MTLLSLFMTSTGIFCFVPISHRLIESGIASASNNWRLWGLPSVLAQTFYDRKEDRLRFLLTSDKAGNIWSDAEEYHQTRSPPRTPLYSVECALDTDQQPATPYANEWSPGIISSLQGSPTYSLLQSTPIDAFYGCESTSFISDTSLCDSCNTLLRQEIPPDHIPSVIHALALFEAQGRLSDTGFSEREIATLTNAFSMLRL